MTQAYTNPLAGVGVPVAYPINDKWEFDAAGFSSHMLNLAQAHVDFVVVNALTGQTYSMDNGTRRRVADEARALRSTMRNIQPGIKVILCINSADSDETAKNAEYAASGFDGFMLQPSKLPDIYDEGKLIYEFIDLLRERASPATPIILYSNPQTAIQGIEMLAEPEFVAELSKAFPDIIAGIKVSANYAALDGICCADLRPGFSVAVGNALDMFRVFGEEGKAIRDRVKAVVSGPANVYPDQWVNAWKLLQVPVKECNDKIREAIRQYESFFRQFQQVCNEHSSAGVIPVLNYMLYLQSIFSKHSCLQQTGNLSSTETPHIRAAYDHFKEKATRLITAKELLG